MHQRSDRSGAKAVDARAATHSSRNFFLRKWIDAKLMTNQVCYVNSALPRSTKFFFFCFKKCQKEMAETLKRCIFDTMLVKPKCV